MSLDPRDPDAFYVLSLPARFHRGQRQRADEALRHCLRLSPSYAPAYGLLAFSLERHGRHAEAGAYCDKAFELSPLEPLRVIWHSAFSSLAAVRTTIERTYDPACIGQMERLLDTLREAGLPAQ